MPDGLPAQNGLPDDAGALTRHVEAQHHARHRLQLPALVALAEAVETVHFGDEDAPEGLSSLLRRMGAALEVQMAKEELVLFPAIRNGDAVGLETVIAALRAGHDERSRDMAGILRLTRGLALPQGACSTWAKLYEGLADLASDLAEHRRIETEMLPKNVQQGGPADA